MIFRHTIVLAVSIAAALVSAKGVVSYVSAQAVAKPAPASTQQAAAPAFGSAAISKGADGHYWAQAEVNGRRIRCLVDTGATAVALTQADAATLGLDPAALTYDVAVSTANGATKAAQIDLGAISVQGARVDHVKAMVVKDGLSASLLGMTYLGRLSRFEATPTTLVLQS